MLINFNMYLAWMKELYVFGLKEHMEDNWRNPTRSQGEHTRECVSCKYKSTLQSAKTADIELNSIIILRSHFKALAPPQYCCSFWRPFVQWMEWISITLCIFLPSNATCIHDFTPRAIWEITSYSIWQGPLQTGITYAEQRPNPSLRHDYNNKGFQQKSVIMLFLAYILLKHKRNVCKALNINGL